MNFQKQIPPQTISNKLISKLSLPSLPTCNHLSQSIQLLFQDKEGQKFHIQNLQKEKSLFFQVPLVNCSISNGLQIELQYFDRIFMASILFLINKIKNQFLVNKLTIRIALPKLTLQSFNVLILKIFILSFLFPYAFAFGISNCKTQSGSICTECNDYYVLSADQKTCSLCYDSSCKTCTLPNSYNVCTVCDDGYVLDMFKCSLCSVPFCQTCMASLGSVTCFTCVSGYIMMGGGCQTCNTFLNYCSTCSSLTTCSSCISGYALGFFNNCELCNSTLAGCTKCSSSSVCTECNTDGYYLPSGATACNICSVKNKFVNCAVCQYTGLSCTTCSPNYMINGSLMCDTCRNIIQNCSNCSTTLCTACDPGFILFGGSICFPCSDSVLNCQTCLINNCLTCFATFYLQNSTACTLCSNAITNCTNCFNATTCIECVTNSIVISNGVSDICQICSTVIQGCLECKVNTECTLCDDNSGYFLNKSKLCIQCNQQLQFCSLCNNLSSCTTCINNQYALNSSFLCQNCQTLSLGCFTCTNSTYCTSCISKQYYIRRRLCVLCNNTLFQCKQCSPNVFFTAIQCSKCQPGFHLNTIKQCICDKGNLVDKYCIDIVGCTSASSNTVCTGCRQDMILSNGMCECQNGYKLVNEICTNITGCIAIKTQNNTNVCIFCDLQQSFVLSSENICGCKEFYELVNETCSEICGDGTLINLQCDDGNVKNGDGCSSKCQVEKGYKCTVANSVTKCIYQSKFTINLVNIEKIQNKNSGRFIFEFSPAVASLSKMNFTKYLNVSIPNASFNITGSTYSNGFLFINFDFGDNIQGLQATILLSFDPKLFKVSPYNITFPIVSNGLKFSFMLKLQVYKMIKYVLMGLGIFTLLIFIASLPFHKMLGVQTLHTFQLFFIITLIIDHFQEPLDCLLSLKYTIGMMDLWKYNTSVALNAKLLYNRLGVFKQFIENQICISPLTISIAVIFLAYFIRYLSLEKDDKKNNINEKRLIKINQVLYKSLLFPTVVGFSLSSFLALYSETSKAKQWKNPLLIDQNITSSNVNFIFVLAFCIIYSIIFWSQVLIPLKSVTKKMLNVQKSKNWYVSQYLNYTFYMMFSVLGGYQISSKLSLLFFTIAVLIHFILIILKPPYSQKIHGAGIIINQFSLVFLSLSLLIRSLMIQKGTVFSQENNLLLVLIYTTLLILVDIIALVRIIYVIKQRRTKKQQKSIPPLDDNSLKEQMINKYRNQHQYGVNNIQKRNKYLLQNQIGLLREFQWNKNQEKRVILGLQPFEFDRKFQRSQRKIKLTYQIAQLKNEPQK